jgi:hypothetical protein
MIYQAVTPDEALDQGDLVTECPIPRIDQFDLANPSAANLALALSRVVVLTQTCNLANNKTPLINVAVVFDARFLVDEGIFTTAEIKGNIRSGRRWGLYFLPADAALGLPEMIVDFRRLHTVKVEHLLALCRAGKRPGRVRPLYREHLAKHFADTYSRIGLPRPYETL